MNLYRAVLVAGRDVLQGGLNASLFYLLLTPPAGLALALLLRKKSASAFPASRLALLLLFSSFLPLAWGLAARETTVTSVWGLTPLFFSILLCWPVGFFLFFRIVQPAVWGLLFGLAMASREFVWIVVLPLLGIVTTLPLTPEHIQSMCMMLGVIQAGSCLCFALALLWTPREESPRIFRADAALAPGGTRTLMLLFAAGILFFGQIGMEFQAAFPRSAFQPEPPGWIHPLLLIGIPLAGWLLDGGAHGVKATSGGWRIVAAVAACIALAMPLLLFARGGGHSGVLFSLMSLARDCVFLILFVTISRVTWNSPWPPLLGCLAYSLYAVQAVGAVAGREIRRLLDSPAALTVIELGMALAFAAFLALALRRAEKHPLPVAEISPSGLGLSQESAPGGQATYALPQTPRMSSGLMPPRAGQPLAFAVVILLFVVNSLGAVFLQLRGLPSGQLPLAVFCFQAGILIAALALDALPGLLHRRLSRRAARLCLAFAVAFPGLFLQVYFRFAPFSGNLPANLLLFFAWGPLLAVSLRLFFIHVSPERQALYLGMAMGLGHLCWSLIVPMAETMLPDFPALQPDRERFFFFLNLVRAFACIASAALVWKLTEPDAGQGARPEGDVFFPDRKEAPAASALQPTTLPDRRFLFLLPPLVLYGLLNGLMGYISLSRTLSQGAAMEYAHLIMLVAVLLAGLAVARKGSGFLMYLMGGAGLLLAASPLALLPGVPTAAGQAAYVGCFIGQELLLFSAMLAMARFAPYSRRPALFVCLPWLVYLFSVAGSIAAARVFPMLGIPPGLAVCGVAALCSASVFFVRRAFPLPEPPCFPSEPDREEPVAQDVKLAVFTAAHGFTAREEEVLTHILEGRNNAAIAGELGISESTVRFHLGSLLKKTDMANRKRLIHFYTLWNAE